MSKNASSCTSTLLFFVRRTVVEAFPMQSAVGEILARNRDARHVEVALEVIIDLAAGSRLANLAEMLEDRTEQRRGAVCHIRVHGVERRA